MPKVPSGWPACVGRRAGGGSETVLVISERVQRAVSQVRAGVVAIEPEAVGEIRYQQGGREVLEEAGANSPQPLDQLAHPVVVQLGHFLCGP